MFRTPDRSASATTRSRRSPRPTVPGSAVDGVGYVFQQYNLIPHLDVAANVELPQRLAGESRRAARPRSIELLEALGLTGRQRAPDDDTTLTPKDWRRLHHVMELHLSFLLGTVTVSGTGRVAVPGLCR